MSDPSQTYNLPPQNQGPPANNTPWNANAQPPPGQTPTHDQLSQIQAWGNTFAAREKQEGRQQVEREIAEKLGCTLDEAASALKNFKEAEAASLTEAQRLMTQAQELDTRSKSALEAAHQMIYDGLREDALVGQGMTRDQARISRNLIHIDGEVTVDAVVAAAQAVKVGFPQLFTSSPNASDGQGDNGAQGTDRHQGGPPDSATRGTPPPSQGTGNTPKDRALARLRGEQPTGRLRIDGPPPEMDYRRTS